MQLITTPALTFDDSPVIICDFGRQALMRKITVLAVSGALALAASASAVAEFEVGGGVLAKNLSSGDGRPVEGRGHGTGRQLDA